MCYNTTKYGQNRAVGGTQWNFNIGWNPTFLPDILLSDKVQTQIDI